jgi:hypothetical protein
MKALLLELIPHAPNLGLYVAPNLPADKVRNALQDYAKTLHYEDVIALYDATLIGNAKDGAVFTADRLVFQNNNLMHPQEIRYVDLVNVEAKKKWIGGQKVHLEVNRGRATIQLEMDFSGKPEAAAFVARFLSEALQRTAALEMDAPRSDEPTSSDTDVDAVDAALRTLVADRRLTPSDFERLMALLRAS